MLLLAEVQLQRLYSVGTWGKKAHMFVLQHKKHLFGNVLSSEVPHCTVQLQLWSLNSLSGERVLQMVRLTLLFNLRRIFLRISVTDSLEMLLGDM
jgi:hypothetical protein